jgi:hypothetical protein
MGLNFLPELFSKDIHNSIRAGIAQSVKLWAIHGQPGSIPGRTKRFFSAQLREDRLWGSPSLLSNEYREIFRQRQRRRSVKLTIHLHLLPRSRMLELYLHYPILIREGEDYFYLSS